jgi:hypothetical protein
MKALPAFGEMLAGRMELRLGEWWDERQCVDLAVRMVQGDPDLLALVLEDVDVGDLSPRSELSVAVGPDVDQKANPIGGELGQRELVLRRVDDDLAAGRRRPDRSTLATVRTEGWERFSNTTTSNVSRGTSEAPPTPVGQSGQKAVGRKVRSLRSVA